jgi:3-deoxy-manno-octulosonate cytidylyltransferase (CMP-KDO synthetase)
MIQHVYLRASAASLLSRVIVATDDPRIERVVRGFGGEVVLTSPEHACGTDRVGEVARIVDADYFINIQGDEPLVDPAHIDSCARMLLDGEPMCTLAARARWRHELFDQNVVKVVIDHGGHAIYFSRSAIPFPRKYLDAGRDVDLVSSVYLRHVGIYGYSRSVLKDLSDAGSCEIEEMESLEQLRALVLGIPIKVAVVDSPGLCVDVPGDIGRIEDVMSTKDQR